MCGRSAISRCHEKGWGSVHSAVVSYGDVREAVRYKTVCHGYSPLTAGGKVFSELEYGIPKLRNVGVSTYYYIHNILCYHSYIVLGHGMV